jgi:hypothetical protein
MSDILRRFLDLARASDTHDYQIEQFERAIPLAQSIALFSDPLDATNEAIGAYIQERHAALDAGPEEPTDPNHELEKSAATENAIYYIALAVGLLAADQLQVTAGGGR